MYLYVYYKRILLTLYSAYRESELILKKEV